MICPFCKEKETSVIDSRPTEDGTVIRRRRECSCKQRFTTFERVQLRELIVVKKNGRKSTFDREKVILKLRRNTCRDQSYKAINSIWILLRLQELRI